MKKEIIVNLDEKSEKIEIDDDYPKSHYESEQIINYINKLDQKIIISDETKKLLDTGGAIKKAFKITKAKNMIIMNSDVLWNSHSAKSIQSLIDKFNTKKMDSLLLTTSIENTAGYSGLGDFVKNKDNQFEHEKRNYSPVRMRLDKSLFM